MFSLDDVVAVGQSVAVRVVSIDLENEKVALSMKPEGAAPGSGQRNFMQARGGRSTAGGSWRAGAGDVKSKREVLEKVVAGTWLKGTVVR